MPTALDLLKIIMHEGQLNAAQWMAEKWRSEWMSMATPLHLHFLTHQQRPTGMLVHKGGKIHPVHTNRDCYSIAWRSKLQTISCAYDPCFQVLHGPPTLVELDESMNKRLLEYCPGMSAEETRYCIQKKKKEEEEERRK